MKWLSVLGLVIANRAAATPYPLELVDRPLALPSGMTTLDIGEDFPTYVNTSIDDMGHAHTTTTSLGHDNYFDASAAYAIGPVAISTRMVNDVIAAGVALDTGLPGVLSLGVSLEDDFVHPEYTVEQSIGYTYKRVIAPHRSAVLFGGGLSLVENRRLATSGDHIDTHATSMDFGLNGELQLTRHLVAYGGPGTAVALEHSRKLSTAVALNVHAELLYAFHRLDCYVAFEIEGLATTIHPYATTGVVFRFGLPK